MTKRPSIIVYGPQGSGKTRAADALRRHYGLDQVIEEAEMWPDSIPLPRFGALVLACTQLDQSPSARGLRRVSIDDALREAGAKRAPAGTRH